MRTMRFDDFQFIETKDLENIGKFQREAEDALVAMGIGTGKGWDGFNVVPDGLNSVKVVMGTICYNGAIYGIPDLDVTPLDLLAAAATSSKRIVTIVATGAAVDTAPEPRSFEDDTTGEAVARSHFTENRRKVSVTFVIGDEAAVPSPSTSLLPNYVPIAYVTMQAGAGVVNIQMAADFQVKTLQALEARILTAEATLNAAGTQLETLGTTIANTQKSIATFNLPLFNQTARAVAELRSRVGLSNDGLLNGVIQFMDLSETDETAVGYKARIDEGLRPPWAATAEVVPQLLNPSSGRVKTVSGWTLPAYQLSTRLDVWRQDISVTVSDYNWSDVSATIYPGSQTRRRAGTTMIVTENSQFWQEARYTLNYISGTFSIGDEDWVVTDEWIKDGVEQYRVERYFSDKIKYWNGYQSLTAAVSGNLLAQTFWNNQPGWLMQAGLRFAKVTDNDLKLYVTGVEAGQPSFKATYTQGLLEDAQASVAGDRVGVENLVTLEPFFMKAGEAFALQFVTAGDFAVACRADNYLTMGSLFNGDGLSYKPDLGKDANVRLHFAQFEANYVEVELESVTLPGGMTDIEFLSTEYVPEGAELICQYQVGGNWYSIDEIKGTHPLAQLPTTVPTRLVYVGTREAHGGVNLAKSRFRLYRADDDVVWQSIPLNCGTAATTVQLEIILRNWDDAKHDLTTTIIAGGGPYSASVETDEELPNGKVRRTMTITLDTPSASPAIRLVGTTTDRTDWFVPEEIYYNCAAA